jgi:hypothetical protein
MRRRLFARLTAALVLLVLSAVAVTSVAAQTDQIGRSTPNGRPEPRTARSATASAAPVIDGKLDEEAWQRATPLGDFTQREPRLGEPVSEETEVRILTDGQALYVGAWLYDRTPDAIVPGERLRDAQLTNSDYFGLILDTYLDRQNGFIFSTTPSGIEYDGQVVKEGEGGGVSQQGMTRAQAGALGGFNLNWDGTWTVATSIDEKGWYAEFRIPFSTLRYGGGGTQAWGLNLVRGIRRHNEEAFWAPIPRQFNLMRLSMAGTLEGLTVPTRRVATVTPYVLGDSRRDYATSEEFDQSFEWGGEAKFGVTPSLTLDLTYNTDFAQVEVDEQRVNLTRFPLFFPEKRPFFLENAGTYSAGTPQVADLFFTRRIGIDPNGQPVPILGGGRVSGRVGGMTVGLLQIFTDGVEAVQPENSYTVGRVTKEVGARSRVGAIFVQRVATDAGSDHNQTYAVDGRVGFSEAWTLDWWGALTETPGRTGREGGMSFRLGQQTAKWTNSVRFIQIGEDFNPEVGFLPRKDYRYYELQAMRIIRSNSSWMRQWIPHVTTRGWFGFDGSHQSTYLHIDPEFEFTGGGRFGPELNLQGETLTAPFTIAPGVVLPPGRYGWVFNGWDIASNPSAPLSVSSRIELGGFYDGTKYGGNVTVTGRVGGTFTGSLQLDYNDVNLPAGDFIRSLAGVRLGYYFTPRIFLQSLVQYSNQADAFSANVRFGWLDTAGTGLYLVFNDSEEAEGMAQWTRPITRSVTIKYTRQFGTRS